ncbi:MAG TPA: hypothetical protein VIV34_12395 [Pseudolabrys sp.]
MRYRLPNACSLLFCVGVAVTLGLQASSASAQASSSEASVSSSVRAVSSASAPRAASKDVKRRAGDERHQAWSVNDEPYIGRGAPHWQYFVEFRARNAASYGHLYVMFGKVNDRHEIIKSEVAGFFPAGDDRNCVNCSVYNWTIGHVLPVPSEIGASDGDLEEQYVLARFRVWVDAQQYQSLIAYINERKANKGFWNAFLANCVTFGRDVASFLKVKMPPLIAVAPSVVMYPKDVVDALREANGVKKEQMPLRDAAGERLVNVGTNGQHANKGTEK